MTFGGREAKQIITENTDTLESELDMFQSPNELQNNFSPFQ